MLLEELVAVDAVCGKLVSATNSLVSGNFAGNARIECLAQPRITLRNPRVVMKNRVFLAGKLSGRIREKLCRFSDRTPPKIPFYPIGTSKRVGRGKGGKQFGISGTRRCDAGAVIECQLVYADRPGDRRFSGAICAHGAPIVRPSISHPA
jgi:hypothetical protein